MCSIRRSTRARDVIVSAVMNHELLNLRATHPAAPGSSARANPSRERLHIGHRLPHSFAARDKHSRQNQ